jgi:hypothetical protein
MYGFLYKDYKQNYYFWELIRMSSKIISFEYYNKKKRIFFIYSNIVCFNNKRFI